MLRVCLINPPLIRPQSWGKPSVFQPLGLAYIAAVLEKEHHVNIIDANAEGWRNLTVDDGRCVTGLSAEELKERIRSARPDVVGISLQFSVNEASAVNVATIVKSVDKGIFTILGGAHPTVRPVEMLSHPVVDFIVVGEGEHTAVELIQKIEAKAYDDFKSVRGIGYKKDGKPLITEPRPLIQDLDSLPFPARRLLPMEEYFAAVGEGRGQRQAYTLSDRWASMFTSRGCPYGCNFCSIHLTMGKRFRARSPENVVQELEQLVSDYGIKHINFEDDNITFDRNRFKRLCDLIVERGLKITWSAPNGIRADILDDDAVRKMRDSGCKRVYIAPESGVQRVVSDIVKKKLDLKKVEEAVVLLKKYGILVDAFFVIGLIGETKDDMRATIRYAKKLRKLGLNAASFNIATPLYGTELYNEAKQKGYLKKDMTSNLLSPSEASIETPEWTGEEVFALKQIAWLEVNYSFKQKLFFALTNLHKYRQWMRVVRGLITNRRVAK